MRMRMPLVLAAIATFGLLCVASSPAKVTTISPDGEATVNQVHDFSGDFDLIYKATLKPEPTNTSWSMLSIALLNIARDSGITVGIYAGPKLAIAGFTSTNGGAARFSFRRAGPCVPSCTIELRGDAATVRAFIGGRVVASWTRWSYNMPQPYVQLNAEVTAIGDTIDATLVQQRAMINGKAIPFPICGFTTQGVEPTAVGDALHFRGKRTPGARVTYLSLVTGATGDSCPALPR